MFRRLWQNKVVLCIFTAILLCLLAYGFTGMLDSFTSGSSVDIALQNKSNYTIYINIPRYSYISNFTLNITVNNYFLPPIHRYPLDADTPLEDSIGTNHFVWQYNESATSTNQLNTSGQKIGTGAWELKQGMICLDNNPLANSSGSVNFWVNMTGYLSNIKMMGINSTDSENNNYFMIWVPYSVNLKAQAQFQDITDLVDTGPNTILNTWTMITLRYNESAFEVLVDGEQSESKDIGTWKGWNSTYYFCLGADRVSEVDTEGLVGLIDEVTIWDYELSNNGISLLYNSSYGAEATALYNRLNNFTIDMGLDDVYEYNASGDITNISFLASLNTTGINSLLSGGCVCTNCTINDYYCTVPITFFSSEYANITVEIWNITYGWGFDNCSLYNDSAFNITSRDQKTNNLLATSAAFQYDYYPSANPSETESFTWNYSGINTYAFCKYPSWANISGDMAHTFSSSGYENFNFYRYDEPYVGLFTVYLLPTETTSAEITYTLLDESGTRVEGANMKFYRVINNVLTLVHEEESDFAGQVSLYQDQQYKYTITINATGFPFKSFELKPASTSYTITLTATGTTLLDNPYEAVRYRIIPNTNMFNISTEWQNITFEIYGSDFEYVGINLTNHSYSCEPASCSMVSTSSTGGIVSVAINLTETGGFYSDFFFKKTGEEIVYINSRRNSVAQYVQAARGIMLFIRDMKTHLTLMQRTVIASLITAIFAVIAAQIGIAGPGLLLVVTLMNIFWSLPAVPAIGFEGVEMIHPAVGLILAIFGIGIYAVARLSI